MNIVESSSGHMLVVPQVPALLQTHQHTPRHDQNFHPLELRIAAKSTHRHQQFWSKLGLGVSTGVLHFSTILQLR